MNEMLEKVYDFAARAHHGQERKYTPDPYIVHPDRVMKTCMQFTTDPCILSAALLHDVLEDTEVTEYELGAFLQTVMSLPDARQTLQYVIELTDVYIKKDYPQWNRKTRKSKELDRLRGISAYAQTIKYADMMDNSTEIAENDRNFAHLLLKEYTLTLRALDKGNSDLREKAQQMILAARERWHIP